MENSNEKSEKTVIVLNAMYSGKYLNDNMGHEIINLFKADKAIMVNVNGTNVPYQNFIYLNPYGNFNSAYKGRIKDMLMVISVPKKNMFEVVGKATDLVDIFEPVTGFNPKLENKGKNIKTESPEDQVIKSQEEKIGMLEYGGRKLSELFNKDQQQAIFVTFAAKSVCRPNKRWFIKLKDEDGSTSDDIKDSYTILLKSKSKAKQSQKQYFDPQKKEELDDVEILKKLLNDPDNWCPAEGITTAKSLKGQPLTFNKDSLFNICKIGDDELAFSNALAFYIEKYPHLFSKTFDLALNKSTDKKIIVEREWNHIDIYVKIGDNKRIIIENKIHSGINCSTKETDENANKRDGEKESQLGRYWRKACEDLNEDPDKIAPKKLKAFLLCPNYKKFELENGENNKGNFKYGDKYTIITYSKLHSSLIKSNEYKNQDKPDRNFQDFVNALKKHTYESIPKLKYAEMEDQFKSRINKQ